VTARGRAGVAAGCVYQRWPGSRMLHPKVEDDALRGRWDLRSGPITTLSARPSAGTSR